MSKLFVITFKRPSTNLEKTVYGQEFTHCYDCEATGIEAVANSKVEEYKANPEYSDIDLFECEESKYVEFCKMGDAYVHFAKTGEHSLKDDKLEEGYKPPYAIWVLDGDDNKWKPWGPSTSGEFDKDDFLAKANKREFPNGTFINNYIDAVIRLNDGTSPETYMHEDVDVGTDTHTETIHLKLEMTRQLDDASFEYHVDIDDVGQIVFTPVDNNTSFTDINRLAGYDTPDDIIEGNKRTFAITLTANMLSEDKNFDWFYDLDEVGQAVITPDSEATSFLTVAIDDSLNLVTECNESLTLTEALDPTSDEYAKKRGLCVEVMTDLDDMLDLVGKKFEALQRLLEEIGIEASDFEKILKAIAACHQGREGEPSIADAMRRIREYESAAQSEQTDVVEESVQKVFNEDLVMEELDEEERLNIIDRFMKGEVTIVQVDEVPVEETVVRLADLDSKAESGDVDFYYDTEKDVVVCHNKRAK